MSKPVAVIIGDVHFTVGTLDLATRAVKIAMWQAMRLRVPLILNGDTLDSKAIIRGECANRLIEILEEYNVKVYVSVGNHDLINEKGSEHSLNFLKPYCDVIQTPVFLYSLQSYVIPYQTSPEALQSILDGIPKGSRLILHQGVRTAFMGHYIQDKTSLPQEAFADYRVIASHYHRRQDIKCGRPRRGSVGLFSYVGNPYSLSFGEANDGPKGLSVLMDDGSLEFHPLGLRSHKILELNVTPGGGLEFDKRNMPLVDDLVWVKARGSRFDLNKLDKILLAAIVGHTDYKLEKIYQDTPQVNKRLENLTNEQLFDSIIDSTSESQVTKEQLKKVWRELL